jgi:glycosidase
MSVAAEDAAEGSMLNVYKTWSRLRNTYPALALGKMSQASVSGSSIAAWYMTEGNQKLLVIHNVANARKVVQVSDSMAKPLAVLGTASASGTSLTLGPNSSVVFEL